MTCDQISSLQQELQQFVLHTRNRLDVLLTSINQLKDAANENEPVTLDVGPAIQASCKQVKQQPELESPPESTEKQRLPPQPLTTAGPASEETPISMSVAEDSSDDDSNDAFDRLEAIKRRLARQIENI